MRIILIFLLLFAGTTQLFAQDKDEELAAQYYASGEFAKAADLYEKLLRKQPSSAYIYSNYLNSLLNLNRFDDAEKMVKNQARKFDGNFMYAVDLVYVYEKAGEPEKAEKHLKSTIKDTETAEQAGNLAQALMRRNKYEPAVETYLRGRKMSNDDALFARELANTYAHLGKKEELISESMILLSANPGNMEQIQNLLQSVLSDDKDWDLLKKELSVRIQKSPENIEFLEMLMWTMVQQKSFNAAFIQFRALDKRLKENGKRLMELAVISKENKDYETAVKCYRYVADLGEEKPFYYQAQFGLLNVQYEQITETNNYDSLLLAGAEKDYLDFINRYGNFYQVDQAMKQLAELYTFYLHKTDKAMELLQSILKMPRTEPQLKAHTKLHLGDVYLISGDVWEAELLYSQVDKDFKEDALGREAKFRMAKLFFYKGEFERAKAYLDVLKTATTQLISNDAIELGMLIQDNTGFDSTEDALAMYAHAELLIFQNKIEEGLRELKVLENIHPKHALADEILYIKARAALKQNNPKLAAKYFNDIITMYAYDILGDNATFALAQLYDYRLKDSEKAQALYEKLMLNYPGSLYVVEARKRYRELRGDKADVPDKQQLFFNGFTN